MRYILFLTILFSSFAQANNTLQVGDGQIDGTSLAPYKHSWAQCSLQEGNWVSGEALTEQLTVIGDTVVRVQQLTTLPDGGSAETTAYLDRKSLAPLRLEQKMLTADGQSAGEAEHTFTQEGYTGRKSLGERSMEVEGVANRSMLHGGVMGLPLATLDKQTEPLEFAASMIGFDATYKVIATWVGDETLEFNGNDVIAAMVDIHWVHNEIGDVYPGGPSASGGRYWLVQNPPMGFPYVPRYQTDTYAIEFTKGVCPDTA